jgi:hypothetical protein
MEQSPSTSQEISCRLYNPKVRCHFHKGLSLVIILSQMFPVHNFPPFFPKIDSNIILTSEPKSS